MDDDRQLDQRNGMQLSRHEQQATLTEDVSKRPH